jgi:hypothetical protein
MLSIANVQGQVCMRALGTASLVLLLAACSPEPAPAPAVDVAAVEVDTSALNYIGIWSADGQRLFDRQVISPDGRYLLEWTPRGVEVTGAWQGILEGIDPTTAPELLWSAIGDQLAISWSEGGAVGPWRVNVISFGGEVPVDARISQLFFLPFGCAANGANVAAVAWLDENEILLAAERPESTCTADSLVTGIRVSLASGQQGEEITEEALVAGWRVHLGPRVLNSADSGSTQ